LHGSSNVRGERKDWVMAKKKKRGINRAVGREEAVPSGGRGGPNATEEGSLKKLGFDVGGSSLYVESSWEI